MSASSLHRESTDSLICSYWNVMQSSSLFFLSSMGAPVMVELEGETDPLKIAMKELK